VVLKNVKKGLQGDEIAGMDAGLKISDLQEAKLDYVEYSHGQSVIL